MERDQRPALSKRPGRGRSSLSRREVVRRAGLLGLSLPLLGAVLATRLRRGNEAARAQDMTLAANPAASPEASPAASPEASPVASPVASPSAAVTIRMTTQLRFEPPDATIKLGETITWINDSPIPHTTTGDPEKNPVKETRPDVVQLPPGAETWDSGLLTQGQTFSHPFTVAGTYKYFCIPHVLSEMLGTITVEG